MTNSSKLTCLLFNDLYPWERSALDPLIQRLEKDLQLETVMVTESERRYFKKERQGNFWVVARNWFDALAFLSGARYQHGKIFLSVFQESSEKRPLHSLILNFLKPALPNHCHLLVHSPLDYRFYAEIEGFKKGERVTMVPLTLPDLKEIPSVKSVNESLTIGTYGDFTSENNINYLLGVAHYITQVNSKIQFRVLGRGPLYTHYLKMIQDMGLSGRVSVAETVDPKDIALLDVLLYLPFKNHHFIPVLLAASQRIAVLSVEVLGIEQYLQDGHSGFVVPLNEIKPMGELVLRLSQDPHIRLEMGKKLLDQLKTRFDLESVIPSYVSLFLGTQSDPAVGLESAA